MRTKDDKGELVFSRSPFFYVGDKHKLLPQILPKFPNDVNRIVEPFVGGGSVFLNSGIGNVLANDIDTRVIEIHEFLSSFSGRPEKLIDEVTEIGRRFGLTMSYKGITVPAEIKSRFPKTYYAEINRRAYAEMKDAYNASEQREPKLLYALILWGFNRMIRFNQKGEFNVPVGNVDFNSNAATALINYAQATADIDLVFSSLDFENFIERSKLHKSDFIYVDPPYLITASEYNRQWNLEQEERLYSLLDELDKSRIKFAVSNVETYGEKENETLTKWMSKYKVHTINSNYINYFDNGKKKMRELLVCNYG